MSDTIQIFGVSYSNIDGLKVFTPSSSIPLVYYRPQGTLSITSNNTYDVAQYASVNVSVSGGGSGIIQALSITPSESAQTFNSSSVDGYKPVTVSAISSTYVGSGIIRRTDTDLIGVYDDGVYSVNVPSGYYQYSVYTTVPNGSATGPSSITQSSATVSTGTNTLTLTKTGVSTTPTVSAGYVSSATSSTATVALTASVTTKAATTYYAGTSDQTIAASQYLTGAQTIKAVSQTNLTAANIKSGTTISISNGSSNIWSVTGTYSGGGGSSMNVQTNQSTSRTTSTSLTSLNSLTCSTAGTYDVYWTCARSSTSGTWNSQLYLGDTAYGSAQSTWSNHVQTVKLTGVSISADQTVAVYARSRGNNYYAYAPQLTIVQTA